MTDLNEQQRQHLIYKNAILYFLYETFGDGAGSIELDDVEYDPAIKDFHYPPFIPTSPTNISYGVKSGVMFAYIQAISPDVNTSDFLHNHAGDDISKAIVEVIGDQWNRVTALAKEFDQKLPAR